MDACTPDQHVYAGWILGTPCQCGATVVTWRPDRGVVQAEPVPGAKPVAAPDAAPVAMVVNPLDAEVAADAAQAESEADQEAEDALGTPRRRKH